MRQDLIEKALAKLNRSKEYTISGTSPVDANSFGSKHLSRIEITDSVGAFNLISKHYPGQDLPMFLSGNNQNRELKFFSSSLFEQLQKFYTIPHLSASDNTLLMLDVSAELAAFGPPNMPTEQQMREIIESIAHKDAGTLHCRQSWLASCPEILTNTGQLFTALADQTSNPDLVQQILEEWPWLEQGYIAFSQEYPQEAQKLLESFRPEVTADLESLPHAVQHGDFYFGNIGLTRDNEVIAIDWENISWAPIGLDLVTVTNGMPPMPFTDMYINWYVNAFNSKAEIDISVEQMEQIQNQLKPWLFLTSGLFDLIRFGFWPESPLPQEHQKKIQEQLLKQMASLPGFEQH